MARILLIETSTSLCSVALCEDGRVLSSRQSSQPRSHAAMTAVFIKEILCEQAMLAKDLDAVCLSAGPGSYTGLRVGSSTAKGLCFACNIPLLAVSTLEVLANQAVVNELVPPGTDRIVPLLDARRMEVYTAVYDSQLNALSFPEAKIIDSADCYGPLLQGRSCLFIGDGAAKCSTILSSDSNHFVQTCPTAMAMAPLAFREYEKKNFKDCAYFEPFYLKQFVATQSKKKLF